MQIADFIDSKDIREHLKKIDYKFKSDEAAFVVWQSSNKSIEKKHEGYEWIINNMPDMNLKERVPRAYRGEGELDVPEYHSLHNILKKHMETEKSILNLATENEDGAVFLFKTYSKGDLASFEDERLFQNIEAMTEAIEAEKKEYGFDCLYLKKQWIFHDNTMQKPKYVWIKTNPDGIVFDYRTSGILTELQWAVEYVLDEMWFDIPTPFQKGDVVCNSYCLGDHPELEEPFVLDTICYWGVEDIDDAKRRHAWSSMDMTAYGYFPCEDGRIYKECMHNYLCLEYYRKNYENEKRILKALSNYIKGEIDTVLMLHAYDVILKEEDLKRLQNKSYFMDEYLSKAGIKD